MTPLNQLVATVVMKWKIHPRNTAHYMLASDDEIGYLPTAWISEWNPSTDLGACAAVLEKIENDKWSWFWRCEDGKYLFTMYTTDHMKCVSEFGSTKELALCRCAVRAYGGQLED